MHLGKGIPQEALKGIACVSMLADHIGAILIYPMYLDACMVDGVDMLGAAMPREAAVLYGLYQILRIIGRLAFPIYCFLLAEGIFHTHNTGKYILRLAAGALLSELPFDLAFSGGLDFGKSSVMVTLVLGCCMVCCMEKLKSAWRYGLVVPFVLAAEYLHSDYAGTGIAMIALFALTRQMPGKELLHLLGLVFLCWTGERIQLGHFAVPMQLFAVFALIPIAFYNGRKSSDNKFLQWGFYLFYPVHLLVLWVIALQ